MKEVKTFLKLAEYIIRNHDNIPLTANEIWIFANEEIKNGLIKFTTKGKTPWASMGAILGTVVNNTESIFIKTEDSPAKFYLKDSETQYEISLLNNNKIISNDPVAIIHKTDYEIAGSHKIDNDKNLEKYMHPVLKQYLEKKHIFSVTINHQKSKRSETKEQWFYPDMVGVGDIGKHSPNVVKFSLRQSLLISLYSYELKRELNNSNIRECYFQALSNSSWANEGYLVVRDIEYIGEVNHPRRRATGHLLSLSQKALIDNRHVAFYNLFYLDSGHIC